jgi:hypothetical protein
MSRVQHKPEMPQQVPVVVGRAAPEQLQVAKVSSRTSVQSSGESHVMCGMIKVYKDRTWTKFIFGIGPEHHPSQFPASRSDTVQ